MTYFCDAWCRSSSHENTSTHGNLRAVAAKKVQRTVAAEADTVEGLLLSPKRFTAALLRCCASDLERERLFRSLRGEGEWRRCGGDGEGRSIEREPYFRFSTQRCETPFFFLKPKFRRLVGRTQYTVGRTYEDENACDPY